MQKGTREDESASAETSRKVKLLEEQVQYLERRLEGCRQDGAFKLSSIEGLLGNENGKLKARDKDLRRKLQREKEINKHQTTLVRDLTADLRRIQENNRRAEFSQSGWMKHVRLPGPGEWPAIKLGTQQNKKALRHIFQQVEKEGGPPTNLDPSLFLHCVVLFLWWKREATVKMVQESEAISRRGQNNSETEELRDINSALQQRVRTLEDALGDCRAERQTFETTMATNFNQLLRDKYELNNKSARLEDTVSALHLDNNLLRVEAYDSSVGQDVKMKLDRVTADLKARLLTSESELRQSHLHKERMEDELSLASKRIQTLEQDAGIREAICKEHKERLANHDIRREELEKMTSESKEKMFTMQHNLELLEETRNTLKKERDSFLSQLTSALDELGNAKETLQEQRLELKQISTERTRYTQMMNSKDDLVKDLQKDLANQKEAQVKLNEEKEKRRSLEMTSSNHDRIVKELEERMHNEEVDSATLLAELCGTQTEERERLESRIEMLEQEQDAMIDDIETLTNEQISVTTDAKKLKGTLELVTKKLHSMIQRRAPKTFQPPNLVDARRTRKPTGASVAIDPLTGEMALVGSEEPDDPINGTQMTRDLKELIELFVTITDSAFVDEAPYLNNLDVVVGSSLGADEQEDSISSIAWEEDRAAVTDDNNDEGQVDPRYLRSGAYRQAEREAIVRLQALAMMMQARRKAREKDSHGQGPSELTSHPVACNQVKELQLTKQEHLPIESLENGRSENNSAGDVPRQMRERARQYGTAISRERSTGEYQSKSRDLASAYGTEDTDQETPTDSENEDLLSTLEREQLRLKLELAEIKQAEAKAEERLQREEEAHLTSIRSANEYQEECARMQMEKEELLPEPDSQEEVLEDSDEMGSTLHEELERMFLEELASLKEENEHLMAERFQQQMILAEQNEGLAGSMPDLSVLSPRHSETDSSRQRNASSTGFRPDDKCDLDANVEELVRSPREAIEDSKPKRQELHRQFSIFSQPATEQLQLNNQKHNRTTYGDSHCNAPNTDKVEAPQAREHILSYSDDKTTDSSLTESADKPEADQGRERHDLEAKLEEQRCQNARDLRRQDAKGHASKKGQLANSKNKGRNITAPNRSHLARSQRLVSFPDEDRQPGIRASDDDACSRVRIQNQTTVEDDLEGNTGELGHDLTKDRKPASKVKKNVCDQNVMGTSTMESLVTEETNKYLDLQSVSEGVQRLPRQVETEGYVLASIRHDSHKLIPIKELSESRATLLELHPDRHVLQDKLTKALQTEVRLQKLVDDLRAKADSLQTKLAQSNELVSVLQHDKAHLQDTCTVAQKERQNIQRDLRESTKRNEAVDAQLRMSEVCAKRSKAEGITLENMYLSEQAENAELQNRVVRLVKEIDRPVREKEKMQEYIRRTRRLKSEYEPPRTQVSEFERDVLRNVDTICCLASERKTQHAQETLQKQLEEQIDRTFDLEKELDDSRCLIKDLERERDILQDDFIGMLQTRSELKAKLVDAQDQVKVLTRNLEESQILVESLKREMWEYLHQYSPIHRERAAMLKMKLQDMRSDRQRVAESSEEELWMTNFKTISKMDAQKQLQEKVKMVEVETDQDMLQTKRRGKNTELLRREKLKTVDASPGSNVASHWDTQLRVPGQDKSCKNIAMKRSKSAKHRMLPQSVILHGDPEDQAYTATVSGMPWTSSEVDSPMHYEEALLNLRKTNIRLSFDLHLAREALETKTKECWNLQESLQDAACREQEMTNAMKLLQEQTTAEVEMQAKLAKRSEEQEEEIFRLRSTLQRQHIQEGSSTILDQDPNTKPTRLNEMLAGFSREIQGHLDDHMEKTQLQNETDDRKKVQELERHLSNMDAQLSVDKITIQSLSDDNCRLRAMVYKLKERIADNQMTHQKDGRMNAVYQALARAQVRVIATSMAEGSQTILTGAGVFSNPIARTRQRVRHQMGSVGNSLGNSYD